MSVYMCTDTSVSDILLCNIIMETKDLNISMVIHDCTDFHISPTGTQNR